MLKSEWIKNSEDKIINFDDMNIKGFLFGTIKIQQPYYPFFHFNFQYQNIFNKWYKLYH